MNSSTNRKILTTALAVAALLFAAALDAEETPVGKPGVVGIGAETEGFRLTLSARTNWFEIRDSVWITASLRNISTNSTDLTVNGRYYRWTVIGPEGKPVPTTVKGERILNPAGFDRFIGERLTRGEDYVTPVTLNAMFQMTSTGWYTVTLSQKVPRRSGPEKDTWASSGPIKIFMGSTNGAASLSSSSNGVAIVLQQASSNYVVGQPMPLAFVLSNLTDRPLTLHTLQTDDIHKPRFPIGELEVLTREGKAVDRVGGTDLVAPSTPARNVRGGWTQVSAKGVATWKLDLTNSFILTNGVYTAKATVHVPLPDDVTSEITVTSAPITFAVKAPATDVPPKNVPVP